MNNYHTITISAEMSRTAAIKFIKNSLAENPGVIVVDLLEAGFPLHRDFFLVLSRKFPRDRFILRVKSEKIVELTRSLGLQAEVAGIRAEFERAYTGQNIATHNMSMMEYFLYEVRRGWLWLKFVIFERKKDEPKLLHYKKTNFQMVLIVAGLILSLVLLLRKCQCVQFPQILCIGLKARQDRCLKPKIFCASKKLKCLSRFHKNSA